MAPSTQNAHDHAAQLPENYVLNGTWVLGRVLGTGSYATVRLARHAVTGQLAVCKTTTVKPSANQKDMEIQRIRLQREVACLLHLDGHPNIVRIYDVVADLPKDTVHIVMEYVEGEELYEYLKKCPDRRADEETVRNIARQVLNAFVYMHEQKTVLHRDIKLDNIMLSKDGQVKLIDFNLSTMFSTDPSRKLTESVGCIHYASPQILEAAHRIPYSAANGWSDVWSFGVVVFALLQGVFPFKELTPTKLHGEIQRRGGKNLTFPVPISWQARMFITDVLDPYRRWCARDLLNHPFVVGVGTPIWDTESSNTMSSAGTLVGATPSESNGFDFLNLPRGRFQQPATPMHPSLALLKEQLPAPRTPNTATEITLGNMGSQNYFNIQPIPTPTAAGQMMPSAQPSPDFSRQQAQQQAPLQPLGTPAFGTGRTTTPGERSGAQYFNLPRNLTFPNPSTPSFLPNNNYPQPAASPNPTPAAPPPNPAFRGLQCPPARLRGSPRTEQPVGPSPLSGPPESRALAVQTPPATPGLVGPIPMGGAIDFLSPSPPATEPAAPVVLGPIPASQLPTPSTPGQNNGARTPGSTVSTDSAGSGWKVQLAALNSYSKLLMRDAAAKLDAATGGQAKAEESFEAEASGSMTRLQRAAWKMGVHNLLN
ncbi:kinase-like domain-containing protein [Hyaloraphidium curvatum]|nr:kinase-like domain-containing protein [Hyaloraphidium curvatum]